MILGANCVECDFGENDRLVFTLLFLSIGMSCVLCVLIFLFGCRVHTHGTHTERTQRGRGNRVPEKLTATSYFVPNVN